MVGMDKKSIILKAAAEAFGENGYAATAVDQIAARAGISKGSIYNYFQSKQDLFMELFTESLAGDEAQAEALVGESMPAGQKLERLIDIWFESFEHYKKIGGLFLEYWAAAAREQSRGGLTAAFQQIYTRYCKRVTSIITQGITSGQFRPDADARWAAAAIIAMLDGLTIEAILDTGLGVDTDFLDALKKGILASLVAEKKDSTT